MNKKILITGSSGFIGSHLVELYVKKGYHVIAFDRYNIDNSYGWLNNSVVKKDVEFILGDIRDYDSIYKAMKRSKKCIHLAALIGIPYSYTSPIAYLKTNVEGTYNVLESSKNLNYEEIITTSTSEVYGSAQYTPIDEKHPIHAQSPYAASKISADQLTQSYNLSFNLPTKIIRPFNVFGPRQSMRAVIPTIINQILNNKENINLGNVNSKRDYTFVEDTCEGIFKIHKSNKTFGKIINIGSGNNHSIKEIFIKINKLLNSNSKISVNKNRIRPTKSEVDNLLCDNNLIKKISNWKIKNKFDQSLLMTIDWYKKNKELFLDNKYII
jgi:NAD dependent epimerase/dehydratase